MKKVLLLGLILLILVGFGGQIQPANALFESKQVIGNKAIIKNWIGQNILDVELADYGCTSPVKCYAILNMTNYKEVSPSRNSWFTANWDFYFYDLGKVNRQMKNVVVYEKQNITINSSKPIFEDCSYIEAKNNTYVKRSCIKEFKQIQTIVEKWVEIDYYKTTFKTGNHELKIEATRKPNQIIDFVPAFSNVKINEWAWWNNTWDRKQQIDVLPVPMAYPQNITNYQLNLTINYDADMYANFTDLRFIWTDEAQELNATRMYKSDSNWANYYVLLPNVTPALNTTLFVYYDPSTAVPDTTVNKSYVFDFWDDFQDGNWTDADTNYWWVNTTDGWDVSNGYLECDGATNWIHISTDKYNSTDIERRFRIWEFQSQVVNTAQFTEFQIWTQKIDVSSPEGYSVNILGGGAGSQFMNRIFYGGTIIIANTQHHPTLNKWYNTSIQFTAFNATSHNINTTINNTVYQGGVLHGNALARGFDMMQIYTTNTVRIDNVRTYKKLPIEPIIAFRAEELNKVFNLAQIAPANQTYWNASGNYTFSCSAESSDNISAIGITVYNPDKTEFDYQDVTGLNNETWNFQYYYANGALPDGYNYTWKCNATDGVADKLYTSNRTFSVDASAPNVLLIQPSTRYVGTNPYNASVNFTINDPALDSCWYSHNGGANTSIPNCKNNTKVVAKGWNNFTLFANDTFGQENKSFKKFLINYVFYNETFTTPILELEKDNITLYVNATHIGNASAQLIWNDTFYSPDQTTVSGNVARFRKEISIGQMPADLAMPFYWNYTLNEEFVNKTSNSTQNIVDINLTIQTVVCPDATAVILNISDEIAFSPLKQDIDYFITYGSELNATENGSIVNSNYLYVCLDPAWLNFTVMRSQFEYYLNNYSVRNYYLFKDFVLDNVTVNKTAFNLISTNTTTFAITVTDVSGITYDNTIIGILRWYPELNTYKLVEMERTSDDGTTVIHVVEDDVDYRVAVYEDDGDLIYMTNPMRMVCYSAPCTVDITVFPSGLAYFPEWDIVGQLSFNNNTRTFTFPFASNNGKLNLTVYRLGASGEVLACNDSSTAEIDVLSCTVGATSGIYDARVYYSASPATPVANLIMDLREAFTNADLGLIFTFLITLAIVLTALWHPIPAIVLAIIGAGFGFVSGVLEFAIIAGISALAIIIIIVMRKTY